MTAFWIVLGCILQTWLIAPTLFLTQHIQEMRDA